MKRIIILIAVFSMVICSCNREENPKTVSKSGSGAAVDNSVKKPLCLESIAKKIWICQSTNKNHEYYKGISFLFTQVENGKIEGWFLKDDIIEPTLDLYSLGKKYYGEIIGEYNNNEAECKMKWEGEGEIGKMYVVIQDDNTVKVNLQYDSDVSDNFTYQLKPYNLKDLILEDISGLKFKYDTDFSEIELEKWGTVKFVSVVRKGKKRNTLFLYLIDDSENILYNFSEPVGFPNDFKVKDFLFTDINNDNKKDLILVLTGLSDHNLYDARVYTENEMGGFEMDTELRNKLNNSKKPFHKNINDILTYLNTNTQ